MSKSERPELFYSTVHSVLEGVVSLTPERRRDKLSELITIYGGPLMVCLRSRFEISEDDATDVVHQFLTDRLLVPAPCQNLVGQFLEAKSANPILRFRWYLIRALYNFYLDMLRRRRLPIVQVGNLMDVDCSGDDPRTSRREDIAWANQLLNRAIQLMQAECFLRNQTEVWKVFQERILRPLENGEPPVSFAELCAQGLGEDPKQVANLLQTAIRKFLRILREIVAGYLPCDPDTLPAAVEEELQALRKTLAHPHSLELEQESDFSKLPEPTTAERPRRLLNVSDDAASLWTTRDLADYWTCLLQKAPASVAAEMHAAAAGITGQFNESVGRSFADLLQASEPTIETLVALKETAKQLAVQRASESATPVSEEMTPRSVFPAEVAMLIYGLAVGLARLKCNRRISSDPDARFIPRVCNLLEFSWLDADSRRILQEWLVLLSATKPPAAGR